LSQWIFPNSSVVAVEDCEVVADEETLVVTLELAVDV